MEYDNQLIKEGGGNFGDKEELELFGDGCASSLPSSSPSVTLQCEDNQRLFNVEVKTDCYPEETSWELVDVSSNTVMLSKDDFDASLSLYVEKKRLEPNLSCYQFTIYYSVGDGLLESPGSYYSVEYDSRLIKEGREYGDKEESELFGDGCASC